MRRNGFTLVELLVVVAIIVILAGVLYPVFASTRRAAYNATCLSNLKQVGMAVQMYTQDFDEAFPTGCDQFDGHPNVQRAQSDWPAPTRYVWEVVKPYVKNEGLWRCPGDTGFQVEVPPIDFTPNTFAKCGSSYRYNTSLAWVDTNPRASHPRDRGYWAPLTVGAIQKPSETFVMAEPAGHWHNSILAPPPSQRTPENDTSETTYHYNGVHVDGHAKSVTLSQRKRFWGRPRSEF